MRPCSEPWDRGKTNIHVWSYRHQTVGGRLPTLRASVATRETPTLLFPHPLVYGVRCDAQW